MQHTHALPGEDWPRFSPLPWAPEADPTLNERAAAACHDQCHSCMTDLAMEAAANPHTLTVLLNLTLGALEVPSRIPGCAWLEGLVVPHAPLPTVRNRIKGREMDARAVIGMMEEFSTEDRLGIAAAALNVMEQYFEVLHRTAIHVEACCEPPEHPA